MDTTRDQAMRPAQGPPARAVLCPLLRSLCFHLPVSALCIVTVGGAA